MARRLGAANPESDTKLISNLRKQLERKGLTAKDLSLAAGLDESVVSKILRGVSKKPKGETLSSIADALGVDVDYLLKGDIVEAPVPTKVPVCGRVAAGLWFEDDMLIDEGRADIPVVPSRYRTVPQKAWLVSGQSMDLEGIIDGSYVITVDYWMARRSIQDGDIVVVERREGRLRERTVKKIMVEPNRILLTPRSTHPRWQDPIIIPRELDPHSFGSEIEVIGLVIGSYRPF